ncbi:hypothetical protein B0H13DRAFT_1867564 [Mycena leptocephala]|nr:hypothetical protein B0H13DRAFT_1867564 [Mycena leptocephala]
MPRVMILARSLHIHLRPPPNRSSLTGSRSASDFRNYIHLRALNEGGQEVSELLESDRKNSDLDSDVEVTAALIQASSPASSIIAQADAMDTDNSDCKDVDNVPELALRSRALPKKAAPDQQLDSANILTFQHP